MCDLTNPMFSDETKAREHLEALRWADGRFCPHCGVTEGSSPVSGGRAGLYYCAGCKKQFTATVGTVFERSHIPLNKWMAAFYMMASSKKGVSAHQLHRSLGITYKSAWFMAHRIREAMRNDGFSSPLGGSGKTIEADETYHGQKAGRRKRKGTAHKRPIVSLVERGGKAKSVHVERVSSRIVRDVLVRNADRNSVLMTDEANYYLRVGKEFADHQSVKHSEDEYVRGDAHTNTVEGLFSIFKRGMVGIYQHCGEQHLKRYLAEFDFRYSHRTALGFSDAERAMAALRGIEGRRLMYQRVS